MLYVSLLEPGPVLFTYCVAQTPMQSGHRSIVQLTRFYAKINPESLLPLIVHFVTKNNLFKEHLQNGRNCGIPVLRLRVAGIDKRKETLVGNIEIEEFDAKGVEGSFVCMTQNGVSFEDLDVSLC